MERWITALMFLGILVLGCARQEHPAVTETPSTRIVNKPVMEETTPERSSLKASDKVLLGSPELLAGIPGKGPLLVSEITAWLDNPANCAPLDVEFPMWLKPGAGQAKDLKDNPMTRAKIELGRQLFFDKRLSADNTISCASCHEPERGYTVSTRFAVGIHGQRGNRNPPTLLNRLMLALGHDQQFWDGRSTSVEDALLHALEDKTEMAVAREVTIQKLKGIEGYRRQFERVYGDVTWDGLGNAMGCFVRCLVTGPSPYDYASEWEWYKDADPKDYEDDPEFHPAYKDAKAAAEAHPMSDKAKRGEYLFFGNKAWCSACHNGVNFTDELYHNTGIGLQAKEPDLGRYLVTKKREDWGAFKTPSIRAAVWTAPYMHDGSLATLEDVIDWYAHEGMANRNLDYRYKRIEGEELNAQDKQDLVEFVKACSGPLPKVETGRLPE
ncbi:MAG: cytochrome-c peroxidase [Nitrospiraceae bacterium]|nr:MAG: cytochrome-c peroxidase [Nitrospiraceae bacterium]